VGRDCYVGASRRRLLLARRERAGLLAAKAERCAEADRRDDGWPGVLDRRDGERDMGVRAGSAEPRPWRASGEEESGGERKEETSSPRRRRCLQQGEAGSDGGDGKVVARKWAAGGRNCATGEENCASGGCSTGFSHSRFGKKHSASWRVGPTGRRRRQARNRSTRGRAGACAQRALAGLARSLGRGTRQAALGRGRASAKLAGEAAGWELGRDARS
jgi:hypothetical protein